MTQETQYKRLLVAPHGIRNGLIDRINQEIANHQIGKPAAIKIKVNSIVDEATSDALYRASRAGVPVDLWVRGICTIRPGVPGLSENIRVRSILGRFLEHSRLFWFANDGSPSVGIGSADLMHRNLDRRVEVLASITNPAHVAEIDEQFKMAFDDGTASWWLQPDGMWIPHTANEHGEPLLDMQEYLINATSRRRAAAK
jgi:polyphosphate kinase